LSRSDREILILQPSFPSFFGMGRLRK